MLKYHRWWQYYWSLIQLFGKECVRTWSVETLTTLICGVASAAATYWQAKGQMSFLVAVENGLLTAAIFFSLFAVGHIFRVPWLHYENPNQTRTTWHGIGGLFVAVLLILMIALGAWNLRSDWASKIVLGSATADPGHVFSEQLIAYQKCKADYAVLTRPEPTDSLRRRTMKLADEFFRFVKGRFDSHPPYAVPDSSDPNPTEERKAAIKKSQQYDQETQDQYNRLYRERFVGIIREYQSRGVPVAFLESAATNGTLAWIPPGNSWEGSPQDNVTQFRNLAYRVDGNNNVIVLAF